MSRFIRSALFPILIVIIVAMFIEWVIQGNSSNDTPKAVYSAPGMATEQVLQRDLQSGIVQSVIIDPTSKLASVTQTGGVSYVTPVADPVALQAQLEEAGPRITVSEAAVTKPPVVPSFTNDVINGKVASVVMNTKDQELDVTLVAPEGGKATQYTVGFADPTMTTELLNQYQVPYDAKSPKSAWWTGALTFILPFILIIGFWIFIMNQMQGGGSKVMSFGKSKAKRVSVDSPKVTFKDVAGAEEAVEELHEIKEFLENPKKFQQLGARIPKGVLLFGPPGTGKTLLARAVAGEAGVPFFSISGSDFVEMFVGVGASRVRDLFEQAKQNAPCIIFVDEIDAVGRHRGAGMGGGHDEREQTLNQLLVEMDGFEMKDNIILIAATNRPDILDPALLRPGRFDRQIVVDRPDRPGRRDDPRGALARQTDQQGHRPRRARRPDARLHRRRPRQPRQRGGPAGGPLRQEDHRDERARRGHHARPRRAREEDAASSARRRRRSPPTTRWATPWSVTSSSTPTRCTRSRVVCRGQALGFTISLPTEDKFLTTKGELMDTLAMTLGGRAAEEVVFGEITTGAANDLEKATATAKQMIMRFGMSEELGPRTLGHDQSMPFLGREFQQQADYSDEVARQIDDEIRRIIEEAHQVAQDLLTDKRDLLDGISKILMTRETIEAGEFQALVDGVPEEEVFRERDEKAAQRRAKLGQDRGTRRPSQPPVPKPAHVNPVNPETT